MSTKPLNTRALGSCMAITSLLELWFTNTVVHPVTCGVLNSDDLGFTPESIRLLDLEAIVAYDAHHHGAFELRDLMCGDIEMPKDSDVPLLWNLFRGLNDPNEVELKRRIICSEEQISLWIPTDNTFSEYMESQQMWIHPWLKDEKPEALDLLKLWGVEYSWSPEKGDYWVQH